MYSRGMKISAVLFFGCFIIEAACAQMIVGMGINTPAKGAFVTESTRFVGGYKVETGRAGVLPTSVTPMIGAEYWFFDEFPVGAGISANACGIFEFPQDHFSPQIAFYSIVGTPIFQGRIGCVLSSGLYSTMTVDLGSIVAALAGGRFAFLEGLFWSYGVFGSVERYPMKTDETYFNLGNRLYKNGFNPFYELTYTVRLFDSRTPEERREAAWDSSDPFTMLLGIGTGLAGMLTVILTNAF